jgi:hypothetical protein
MANGFIEVDVSSAVELGVVDSGTRDYAGNWAGTETTAGLPMIQSSTVGSEIPMPSSGVKWSHLELILQDSSSSAPISHNVYVMFTWDVTGDDICGGMSDANRMVLCRGSSHGSNCFMIGIDLDMIPTLPPDGTANTVYLWISTTGFSDNQPNLKRARLHWYEIF